LVCGQAGSDNQNVNILGLQSAFGMKPEWVNYADEMFEKYDVVNYCFKSLCVGDLRPNLRLNLY